MLSRRKHTSRKRTRNGLRKTKNQRHIRGPKRKMRQIKSSSPKGAQEPRLRSADGPFPTIVICGLGFGGLTAAKELRRQLKGAGKIIGIDCSDRFIFIPALMAMAGGFFTRKEISVPLKRFTDQVGMEFVHDWILSIDTKKRVVRTKTQEIPYDYAVVALGAASNPLPPGFDSKTLALRHTWDAEDIWKAVTASSLHLASAPSTHAAGKHASGTKGFEVHVGIIGGGATGIQLASWLKDGLQHHLNKTYSRKCRADITLIHSGPELVPGVIKESRRTALDLLIHQGVRVILNAKAKGSQDNMISFEDGTTTKMDAVIFCGGWRQSPVISTLGISFDERTGINCTTSFQSADDPYVFAIGDALNFVPSNLNIPGWKRAQNARLAARTLAYNIASHSKGQPMESFEVKDTPIILDLRPKSILIRNGKTSAGRIWWHAAQWIRRLNLFVVRHPKIPIPY